MTRPLSRRAFLGLSGGSVAAAGLAGCGSFGADDDPARDPDGARAAAVVATGVHQAGVVLPATAQANLLTLVFDLAGPPAGVVAALGRTALALTSGADPRLAGMSPGDLTLTVGVGPRLVAAVDGSLPGARELPSFRRERLSERHVGGDVMVQICASDPLLLPGCATAVAATGGEALTERWRQRAFRGPTVPIAGAVAGAPRNVLGFVDGIVGPRTAADLDGDVWLPSTTRLRGGTIAVLRRMEIDVERFLAQSVAAQEAVIGRRRGSAAPLSGGTISTDPDLEARTPTGDYLIPLSSHVRRAHPPSTGVRPMLRRSYSFEDREAGLFFVSYQNELSTFVSTLKRMAASDALLDFTTTTRSATFLVLPGFDADRRLGASLFSS